MQHKLIDIVRKIKIFDFRYRFNITEKVIDVKLDKEKENLIVMCKVKKHSHKQV